MFTLFKQIFIALLLCSAISQLQAEDSNMPAVEILRWQSAEGVTDKKMIDAVQDMVPDLQQLPGFQYQTLVKTADGMWTDIYFWDTEHDAHKSNELMADKASLGALLALIKPDSVSIEVLPMAQQSGVFSVKN